MIQIMISWDEKSGQMSITSPVKDKVVMVGMLEFAKITVMSAKPEQKVIVPADANKVLNELDKRLDEKLNGGVR